MFDVGFSELLVIAVVALLVLGPERLPRAARLAGMWLRRARAQWYAVQADLERELAQEEFRRSVGQPLEELERSLADEARALRERLDAEYAVEPREAAADPGDASIDATTPSPTDDGEPTPRDPAR
jgi:sec-independent protein translocase protein TatB